MLLFVETLILKMVRNVFIDTDPGVDDAMALMMALGAHSKGQINILAISVAYGNTTVENGLKNLAAILSYFPECSKVNVII